jgi:GAF domain-containing protein
MSSRTALYVGSEPGIEGPLRDLLREDQGIGLAVTRSGREAIEIARETKIGCVVTEYDLPDSTGVELVEELRGIAPDIGCLLYAEPQQLLEYQQLETVVEFVPKRSQLDLQRVAGLVRTTIDRRTQRSYPLPENEDDRLAALKQFSFADQRVVAALERIAEIAARSCSADCAFVNLVDDTTLESVVWYGIESLDTTTFARSTTLCTYTILGEDTMVVEDLTQDPRTAESEVAGPHSLRFYAGAPLLTATGHAIGTLCVIRSEPGSLSRANRRCLELLAQDAMEWIELYGRPDPGEPDGRAPGETG